MLRDRPTRQMGQAFIREAARIKELNHRNVVRLLGVHFATNPLLMVLEYMALGDLKSLLRTIHNGASVDILSSGTMLLIVLMFSL